MVTSFLIAALVFFVLDLALSLINLAINAGQKNNSNVAIAAFNVIILLFMVTWNILALINN